jgi:YHS domain-containing protein
MDRFMRGVMIALVGLVLAGAPAGAERPKKAAASQKAAPLQKAEAKRVCMVNDTLFPKDQIPVQVDGKTYFGCCEMCKGRLASDEAVRYAKDPVSGKTVDKATAVIGAKPDGRVLYFESEKTFKAFGQKS